MTASLKATRRTRRRMKKLELDKRARRRLLNRLRYQRMYARGASAPARKPIERYPAVSLDDPRFCRQALRIINELKARA